MTDPLRAALDSVESRHRQGDHTEEGWVGNSIDGIECSGCGERWPCSATRLRLAADTTRPGRCGCGGDAIIGHTHDCPRFTADTARPGLDVEALMEAADVERLAEAWDNVMDRP